MPCPRLNWPVAAYIGGIAMNYVLAVFAITTLECAAAEPSLTPAIKSLPDSPYDQEYREPFVAWKQKLPEARAALAVDSSGTLWSAGPWGVQRLTEGRWESPRGVALNGPAFALESDREHVWVAAWNGLYRIENGELKRSALEGKPLGLVRISGGRLFAGGPDGLWERKEDSWHLIDAPYARSLTDVAVDGKRVWIGTGRGLFVLEGDTTRRIFAPHEILSGTVRSFATDRDGQLYVGSSGGIDIYRDGERIGQIAGDEGLPCSDVQQVTVSPSGELWVATNMGVGYRRGEHWAWRESLRWLPNSTAHAIAFGPDGTTYVATGKGLAVLRRRSMTLAEKAIHFEDLVRARHVRDPGLVELCILQRPGDLTSHAPTDTDNDGLFTGLYVAAESFRYAVTKDPQAAEFAQQSYRAMEFLQRVTGHSGFVARTVIPSDWDGMADRNRTFTPQQIAAERISNPRFKRVENRWRPSADGKWIWKGDTSSDEMTGHYFAYALYYDLVADETERRRVADHVRRITDHIIAGGYTLRDIDGQPTLWGVWSPEKLWNDPDWQSERGCNSVEILSYLAVTHHVTGDPKYEREISRLFHDERYSEAILEPKLSAPSEFTYIDDQLLALSYRGLLAYDQDPRRREKYLESLRRWFKVIERDHSPLYAFVYGGAGGGEFGADGCVEFLRKTPLDMIEWTVDNRYREDLKLVRRPVLEHLQVNRLLPPDERGLGKWDKNPYQAVYGNGGSTESSSVHWLLPYWMGRYYDIIDPPAKAE